MVIMHGGSNGDKGAVLMFMAVTMFKERGN